MIMIYGHLSAHASKKRSTTEFSTGVSAAVLEIDPRQIPQIQNSLNQLGAYLQNGAININGSMCFDGRDMNPIAKAQLESAGVIRELKSFFMPYERRLGRIQHVNEMPVLYELKAMWI